MRAAVGLAHLGEAVLDLFHQRRRLAGQRDHLVTITLPVDHPTAVGCGHGHAVDAAEAEPSRLDGRVVGLRHLVVTGIGRTQIVAHRPGQGLHLGDRVLRFVDSEMGGLAAGARQVLRRRQHDGVGELLAHRRHLGQRGGQQAADVVGAGEEVADRLVLDGDRRILQAQQMFGGRLGHRLQNAADRTVVMDGGDHEAVAQMEVGLPVDGVVLVAPRHVPDRNARHRRRRIAGFGCAQGEFPVVPLDEQRHRQADLLRAFAGDHAHPPAVALNIDAPVQILGVITVAQWVFGEVVVVFDERCRRPHEGVPVDGLTHAVQVTAVLQIEHLTADEHGGLGESRQRQGPQDRVGFDGDVVVHVQHVRAVGQAQRLVHDAGVSA